MAFKRGESNPNAGRPKGSSNRGTEALRKRIATLTEKNYPRLSEALLRIEADNPSKFIELYLQLLKFTLPQLQSIQQTLEYSDDTISRINVHITKSGISGSQYTSDKSI
jgi:hypothetical protein